MPGIPLRQQGICTLIACGFPVHLRDMAIPRNCWMPALRIVKRRGSGAYALFYDGEYVTNEQMNEKKFLKLLEK